MVTILLKFAFCVQHLPLVFFLTGHFDDALAHRTKRVAPLFQLLNYFKMTISFVAFTVSSHVVALEYQSNHCRTGCPLGRTDGGLIEALKGQVRGPSRNVLTSWVESIYLFSGGRVYRLHRDIRTTALESPQCHWPQQDTSPL